MATTRFLTAFGTIAVAVLVLATPGLSQTEVAPAPRPVATPNASDPTAPEWQELHALALALVAKHDGTVSRGGVLAGGPLTRIDLRAAEVTESQLRQLAGLRRLNSLNIEVTDRTLTVLRELALLHLLARATASDTRGRPDCSAAITSLCLGANKVTDAGLKELAPLKNLTYLNLSGTKVTDRGLKELACLGKLTELCLCDTQITDNGLKTLAGQANLTSLLLHRTEVTDAGLNSLATLPNLTRLGLHRTKVTDAGLKELAKLKHLTYLQLRFTNVTDAGVEELQRALPKCTIDR